MIVIIIQFTIIITNHYNYDQQVDSTSIMQEINGLRHTSIDGQVLAHCQPSSECRAVGKTADEKGDEERN